MTAPLEHEETEGAVAVLRRGWHASPELRQGARVTIALALLGAGGRVVTPVVTQQVIDRGLRGGDVRLGTIWALSAFAALAIAATALIMRTTHVRLARSSEQALFGLRTNAFDHIHRLSVAHHSEEQRGVLVSRVTSDVETLSQFFSWGGVSWITNTAMMLAVAGTMLVYDWRLGLITIVMCVPLIALLRALQRRILAAWDLVRTRVGEMLGAVGESITGAAVIRGYGIQDRTTAKVDRAIDAHQTSFVRAGSLAALLFPANGIFEVFTISGVVLAGLALGPEAGLSAGELVAFLFLVNLFLEPVAEFTELLDHTQTAVAGWRKVLDVLDTPIDVPDPPDGIELPATPPEIRIERISFAYRPGAPVLEEIDAVIQPATRVALVGATGSGKSTLAKLLVRFADPTSGHILVHGVDLRRVAFSSLRSRLVLVPQETFLFDTTIAANVRFANPNATDADVRLAFYELSLDDWLDSLPHGLDTRVGERGEHLSVGERQLVALARAYVANPTCLLLDEATSAVDPGTETRLTRALESLSRGRTSITIAHRLATAERADVIFVLDGGRLVETGSHHELLASGGAYSRLHVSWMDASETNAADGYAIDT